MSKNLTLLKLIIIKFACIHFIMLKIQSYKKSYGEHLVLAIDSLPLSHGIYWIKGQNGSGKSTLFKSIAGIISFEGSIEYNSINLRKQPVRYRAVVNYSEAEPLFPEHLSLKDMVHYFAKAKQAGKTQLEQLIEIFSVKDYMHQPFRTYSSGMLKKSGLLLSFLGPSHLILLDEPFITIDQQAMDKLTNLIIEYHQNGTTFLIASHIENQDMNLPFHKVYKIEHAQIREED